MSPVSGIFFIETSRRLGVKRKKVASRPHVLLGIFEKYKNDFRGTLNSTVLELVRSNPIL